MTWKCANCGVTIPKNLKFPVRCSCGYVDKGQMEHVPHPSGDTVRKSRMDACESCDAYMGKERCKYISLGCSKSFRQRLTNVRDACPKDQWQLCGWCSLCQSVHPVAQPAKQAPACVVQERRVICSTCPDYTKAGCRHLSDGCFDHWRAQTLWPTRTCPRDRWLASWTPTEGHPSQGTRLVITVAVGRVFQEILDVTRPTLQRYAERVGADYVELTDRTQTWAPLEKFRTWEYAKNYDATLFLDSDMLIRETAEDVFNLCATPNQCWMHDDRSYLPQLNWLHVERGTLMNTLQIDDAPDGTCYNSGVILTGRDRADIWQPPPLPFEPTHCAEQLWLEYRALQGGVDNLPLEFNTQYWMPKFFDKIASAQFIHLANCPVGMRADTARRLLTWL